MAKARLWRPGRWTPDQARVVLQRVERSGKSIHGFAYEHGLSAERLYRWKRRLECTGRVAGAKLGFAEVTIRPSAPVAAIEIELPGGVSLRVGGESRVDDAVAILSRLPVR
jgi:transposase-like protein